MRANSLPSSSCWHYTFAKYASQNARTLLAAQTTGIKARDGDVLRVTVSCGLVIELAIGVLTLDDQMTALRVEWRMMFDEGRKTIGRSAG